MLTLQWLFHIDDARSHAEDWLGQLKWGEGLKEAERDFSAGKLRVYSMEVIPDPKAGQPGFYLTNEFTGRMNGLLEVWAWRCYQPEDKLTLRIRRQWLDGYNGRMAVLYQRHILQAVTNTRATTESP